MTLNFNYTAAVFLQLKTKYKKIQKKYVWIFRDFLFIITFSTGTVVFKQIFLECTTRCYFNEVIEILTKIHCYIQIKIKLWWQFRLSINVSVDFSYLCSYNKNFKFHPIQGCFIFPAKSLIRSKFQHFVLFLFSTKIWKKNREIQKNVRFREYFKYFLMG